MLSDLRSGVRALRSYPMLSFVAIVTLGLGLGLATMVFCIVNGAMFKGLPFSAPDRVVALVSQRISQSGDKGPIAVQDLPLWQARETDFDAMGAYGQTSINISTDDGHPERVQASELTVAAFDVIGIKPILGRGFQDGDDRYGAPPVVLISYEMWRDRFSLAPDILSKTVRLDGKPTPVIGVMPERFGFPQRGLMWRPLVISPYATPRGTGPSFQVIARLKPGASVAHASTQASAIAAQIARDFPTTNQDLTAAVLPFSETVLGKEIFAFLYTMLGAGIGVLLIACVNVSNLLVARASLRRKEVAVRMSLGASRTQVIRQHLTEVLLLSALGSAMGLVIAIAGVRWFSDALSVDPPPLWMTFDVDWHVALFVAGLIVVSALFAGGLPALHASRVTAGSVMKDDSRSSTSGKLGRFSSFLVVAELAVSCGLLIAAGLMIKSVVQLKNIKMPFAVENVLTMRVDLPGSRYPDDPARVRFFEELQPKLAAQAGVEAAALSDGLPAAGNGAVPVQMQGVSYAQDRDYPVVREGIVTAGYFETYEVTPIHGRTFLPSDTKTSEGVAIVNESFARQYFGGVDPVGRLMKRGARDSKEPWLTIVGVVPDLLMQGIGNNDANPSGYYIPISQSNVGGSVRIAVRSQRDVAGATALVRGALAGLDPELPVYEVLTMDQVVRRETWFYTVFGTFFTGFGIAALVLAAAGLYGVMSFAVTQRTREMGVRSALGARGTQLVRLIMRRSVIHLGIGLALGLALGLLASGPLSIVLYRVNPRDPAVVVLVVIALAATSLIATALPAWRVTRIDPLVALNTE